MSNDSAGIADSSSDRANRIDPAVWRITTVVILGTIMVTLDTTIVNVAIDPLTKAFHTDLRHMQWAVTGYLLAIAIVIPLTGWLSRRFSPKSVYLVSIAAFTIGSVLCGLASSANQLIMFRVLQGLGGGAIPPIGQAILVRAAGPRNLPRVMSAYGVPTILAPVFGPTVGGLLIVHAGWRWIFFVNLPVGVAAVIAGLRMLPSEPRHDAGLFDVPGLLLAAVGLAGLTYGLSQVPSSSDPLTQVLIPIVGGLLLVAMFVVRSLRVPKPLLDMGLYLNARSPVLPWRRSSLGAFSPSTRS